jgi:hypothetical protein
LRAWGSVGIVSRVDDRDEQILFDVLFDIRDGVKTILRALGEDEDEEEEDA